jgi:hypothetical protein
VYNKEGEKLTEENDPWNMGTFNYAEVEKNKIKHGIYDISPFFLWGNTKGALLQE